LPKTVTRQRRGCDLNPGPSAPESSTLTTRLPSERMSALRVPQAMEQASGLRSTSSTLFGRWQQRCGLQVPVLQQLVVVVISVVHQSLVAMQRHDIQRHSAFSTSLDARPHSALSPSLLAAQSSWHAHDYRQRPADLAPTPHLIRNILALDRPLGDPAAPSRGRASSVVTSSCVGPDDDGLRFGSRGHVTNGLDWSTSGRRGAAHHGNAAATTSSAAADTTLRGQPRYTLSHTHTRRGCHLCRVADNTSNTIRTQTGAAER